ncbi:TniB family NTP-binding protein [Chromobacterium subtsugae]|uniref:TniB family NTP-binding protein n=1 Tax=Chromobacterium subtsugae TaxID=251747 RepID=UPI0006413292|nr:TniB family NTP-binding protein [Chromobacterium subtsugae]
MSERYTLADLRRAERIQILHPQFSTALERLSHSHALSRQGAAARHLLLIGASGTGKTSVLHSFAKQYPNYETEEATIRPVVYVQVPAHPTIRGLAEAILIALGTGVQLRSSTAEKTNQIVQLIRGGKTEALLLDEFHHFVDAGRRTFEEVTEWLKTLIDQIAIPTVLSGLPECEWILRSNEQLRRRFAARVALTPIGFSCNEDKSLFRDVVHAWDTQINQGRPIWGLAEWECVRRLHYASNGLLGYLSKVILGGLECLIEQDRHNLDQSILAMAFSNYVWRDSPSELNPFDANFVFRRLNQPDEPFEPTRFSRRNAPKAAISAL